MVINTNLGLNLTSMDYFEGTRTYSNLIYGSGWTISGGTGPQNVALPAGHTDANGWVTSLPGDYTTVNRVLSIPISSASMVAKWTGNGSAHISLSGSLVSGVDNSVANQTTFTYSTAFSDPNWYATGSWVILSYTFNAADPLKNLDVREVGKSSSQIFETDFMSAAEGYAVVRFISGWQVGVAATGTQTPPTITWATRNQPGFADYTINDGVPVEDMVSFANQASANPWFCMPWGADDTYITNFATYVRDNLNVARKIYVENDNEVWNYGFAATYAAKAEGLSEGLGGITASSVTISSITHNGTMAVVKTATTHEVFGDNSVRITGASPADYNAGWIDAQYNFTPSSITFSGTTATVTLPNHNLPTGALITVSGAAPAPYNVTSVAITSTGTNTFTYTMSSTPATNATSVGGYQTLDTFQYTMATTPASNATVVGSYSLQPITLSVQRRYAEKTAHVMGLWTTVFAGQTSRLVRVAAFQNADTFSPPNTLAWNSNLLANAIDAVASAPYWGNDTSSAEYSGATADTALNTLLPGDIAQTIGWAKTQYATAQSFGKRYIAYEGGQTMTGTNVTLNKSIQIDSRMYGLYGTFLYDWLTQCGGDVNLLTNIAGPVNQFGAWGLVDHIGQTVSLATTPKQQLVNDWRKEVVPLTLTGTLHSAANSSNGFLVGTVATFYPTSTLSIQSTGPTDGSGLAINSTTGAITVSNSANLPAAGSYTVTVRETNQGFPSPGYKDTSLAWTQDASIHSYRYLKLNVTDSQDGTAVGMTEIQVLESVGGPNKALGATYTDSDHFGGEIAANCFDGNTTTDYNSAVGVPMPHWVKIDTGPTSGNWIAPAVLKITDRGAATARAPKTFQLLGSDDDVTYTAIITVVGEPNWGFETRTYTP